MSRLLGVFVGLMCFAQGALAASADDPGPGPYHWGLLVDGKPVTVPRTEEETKLSAVAFTPLCPQTPHPPIFKAAPSIVANSECPSIPSFTSTNEIAYFLLNAIGDTIKTNCPIRLIINAWSQPTGGHCHNVTPKPTGTPAPGNYNGNLAPTGYWRVQHTWPEVSGWILVQVIPLSGCPTFTNSENFWIPVRGPLQEPSDAGLLVREPGILGGYELHGGVDSTRHPDHHYATPNAWKAFADMAEFFNIATFAEDGQDLIVVDVGLVYGGLYDIKGLEWLPPYCDHRFGREFDIRTLDITQPAPYPPYYTIFQMEYLRLFCREYNFQLIKGTFNSQTHEESVWHLTYMGQ